MCVHASVLQATAIANMLIHFCLQALLLHGIAVLGSARGMCIACTMVNAIGVFLYEQFFWPIQIHIGVVFNDIYIYISFL